MNKRLKSALMVVGVIIVVWMIVRGGWAMMGPAILGGFRIGLMSVFWLVVAGLIVWAVVAGMRGAGLQGKPESALEILKKRYARGEINRAEYAEKEKDLK